MEMTAISNKLSTAYTLRQSFLKYYYFTLFYSVQCHRPGV